MSDGIQRIGEKFDVRDMVRIDDNLTHIKKRVSTVEVEINEALDMLTSLASTVSGLSATINVLAVTSLSRLAPIIGAGNVIGLAWNVTNLRLTAAQLNTIQDIAVASSPTFAGLTLSGLTAGSVLFAGAGGVISQDNANFFYDNAANQLVMGAGAVGAPSIAFAGSTTTGFYSVGADTIGVAAAGALDFEFSPNEFYVHSGSHIEVADDVWIGLGAASGRIVFDSDPVPDAIVFNSCNVGIGGAPSYPLDVTGAGRFTTGIYLTGAPGWIRPAADSTTALQVQRLGGTKIMNFDTTNSLVQIGAAISGTTSNIAQLNVGADGGAAYAAVSSYSGASSGSIFYFLTGRGTHAVPTATQSGDLICSIAFAGQYGNVVGSITSGAAIRAYADGNYTAANAPAYMTFLTCPTASATLVERMRITNGGLVGIGLTPSYRLHVGHNQNAGTYIWTVNTTAGTASVSAAAYQSDTYTLYVGQWSSLTTASATINANDAWISTSGTGLNIRTTHASGDIKFCSGGTTLRAILDRNGYYGIGTALGTLPVSLLEVYSSTASPIVTITGLHATAYDPQIQFRTDNPATVKWSVGVDSTDDHFRIHYGTGVAATTDFVFTTAGRLSLASTWLDGPGVANSIMTHQCGAIGVSNVVTIGDDGTDGMIGVGNSGTSLYFLARAAGVYTRAFAVYSDANCAIPNDGRYFYFGNSSDLGITFDGTDAIINSGLVAPSDINITCGANKTIELQNSVYNDANVGVMTFITGGTLPGIVEWLDNDGDATGIYTRGYAVGESGSGVLEIPHDYKEGTNLTFHVHWGANDAPTGTDYVQWELKYSVTEAGQTFVDATTIVIETAYNTQYELLRSNFPAINGAAFKIGMQFNFTLTRIAAAGDAYAGEALVETVGFHYECDTMGSRQITTK